MKTLSYLPFCRVWVDCGEYDEYKRNYPEADIISCPEGVQGNVSRVRNYILDEEFKRGMDVVCIIDDDPSKWGMKLNGVPVVGGRDKIAEAVSRYSALLFLLPLQ